MDDYISYLASLDFKEENIDQNKDQKTKNDKQDDKSNTDNESSSSI